MRLEISIRKWRDIIFRCKDEASAAGVDDEKGREGETDRQTAGQTAGHTYRKTVKKASEILRIILLFSFLPFRVSTSFLVDRPTVCASLPLS